MIKPTVGRMVWFYVLDAYEGAEDLPITYSKPGEPMAAIVAHVINDGCVNLSVFDQNGKQFNATSVPLLDEVPELAGYSFYATWPLSQKEYAAKADVVENKPTGDTPTPAQCGHVFNDRSFVTRDLVMNLICQGKPADYIKNEIPQLLELIFGVDPDKAECERDPDISHALAALQGAEGDTVKASAPVEAAPKLTDAGIESVIKGVSYFTAAQGWNGEAASDERTVGLVCPIDSPMHTITFCVLILKNGYKVTGVNHSSVSPENHDPAYGRELAYKDAKNKIWELEGYLLKQRLHEQQSAGFQAITTEGT